MNTEFMLDERYYGNVSDMILFNWRKCQDGDFRFTRIKIEEGDDELDEMAWEIIYDSYIEAFGLGKEFERVLELRRQIAELQCLFVESDEQFIRNEINQLKGELQDLLDRPVENDTDTAIIHLSKWLGFRIKEKEITVKEFYKMLHEFQKEGERLKKVG